MAKEGFNLSSYHGKLLVWCCSHQINASVRIYWIRWRFLVTCSALMCQGYKDKMFGKRGLVAIPQTHRCLLKSCSELHSPPVVILDALMAKGPGLDLNIKMSDGGDVCFPVCFPQPRCVKFPGESCGHRPAFPINSLGEKSGLGTRCLWPAVSQRHFPADVPLRGAAVALPIPGTQLHGSGLLVGPPSYFGLGPRAAHTADITAPLLGA